MNNCIRCRNDFKSDSILNCVCPECLSKDPILSVDEKDHMNEWDHIDDFLKIHELRKQKKWTWAMNTGCKYIELRIDMRDGGCIIMNREGKRINPSQLAWQYSKETPVMPK
jgi:hypothetical protein